MGFECRWWSDPGQHRSLENVPLPSFASAPLPGAFPVLPPLAASVDSAAAVDGVVPPICASPS